MPQNTPILEVKDLFLKITGNQNTQYILNGINFNIEKGQSVGLVGESGCGKSLTALSILGLAPKNSTITGGSVVFEGNVISNFSEQQYRSKIRGKKISMIFQDALSALNPVFKVGQQIAEVFKVNDKSIKKSEIIERSLYWFNQVGLANPKDRLNQFPHQLSGGMRQRVMIAMALAAEPKLLIADEPTTALDVTIQAQILNIIKKLQVSTGISILFITHDMGVISKMCDQINVMYGGKILESGTSKTFFNHCQHPYTKALLNSIPQGKTKKTPLKSIPLNVEPLYNYPTNCVFEKRCSNSIEQCKTDSPSILKTNKTDFACFNPFKI